MRKLIITESFSYLVKSKYVRTIAYLVLCYGICINLIEVIWKGQLKMLFPDHNDYCWFMGRFSLCTGIISLIMASIGGFIVRKKGWRFAALTTPTVLAITGIVFLGFLIFQKTFQGNLVILGVSPLVITVALGMIQNIASKSTKYT